MRGTRMGLCLMGVLSAVPASAWPRPKGEPAPAPRACPEMGDGFVRVAGSDTCVKIGGNVRVEVMRQSGGGSARTGDR